MDTDGSDPPMVDVDRDAFALIFSTSQDTAAVKTRLDGLIERLDYERGRRDGEHKDLLERVGKLENKDAERIGITKGQAVIWTIVLIIGSAIISQLIKMWLEGNLPW